MRRFRHMPRKAAIVWLVLLALGLHSLIPAGYMPDFSGRGWLAACDGMDHLSQRSKPGADHAGGHCDHHRGIPCPYSLGALFSLAGIGIPVLAPPVFAEPAALLLSAPPPVSQASGSASPRAPPFFS